MSTTTTIKTSPYGTRGETIVKIIDVTGEKPKQSKDEFGGLYRCGRY